MWLNMMFFSECFVILNWYHSPCLSWDPPKEDDSGRVALLGRGATTRVGAGDHAIALFCIEYGCVLGLYFDTLRFEV